VLNSRLVPGHRVVVLDDGDGIDIENVKDNFRKFNDSAEKEDAAQHGLHGRGRLAFHRLCHSATWHTRSKNGDAEIHVEGSNIKNYNGKRIERNSQHSRLSEMVTPSPRHPVTPSPRHPVIPSLGTM
jgi:Histidine kinase-, DNA gyrase B-, and HSP90-like ATPase